MMLCCLGATAGGVLAEATVSISGIWQRDAAGPYRARSSAAEKAWVGEVSTSVLAAAAVGCMVSQRRHRLTVVGDAGRAGRRLTGSMKSMRPVGPMLRRIAASKTGCAVETEMP